MTGQCKVRPELAQGGNRGCGDIRARSSPLSEADAFFAFFFTMGDLYRGVDERVGGLRGLLHHTSPLGLLTQPFDTEFTCPPLTHTRLDLPHPPRPDWHVTDWVPELETLCDMTLPQ